MQRGRVMKLHYESPPRRSVFFKHAIGASHSTNLVWRQAEVHCPSVRDEMLQDGELPGYVDAPGIRLREDLRKTLLKSKSHPCLAHPTGWFAWVRAFGREIEPSTRLRSFVDSMPQGIGSDSIWMVLSESDQRIEALHR